MIIKIARWLGRLEDATLILLLFSLLAIAVSQIFMRNFLDTGVVWFDPLSRTLVLWMALVAAGIATRDKQHLAIDLLHLLPQFKSIAEKLVGFASCAVCLLIAWHSLELIGYEFEDGYRAFANVPVWLTQLVIPASFSLMGVRFIIHCFISPEVEQEL